MSRSLRAVRLASGPLATFFSNLLTKDTLSKAPKPKLLDEVRARDPELVILPDEPHAFSAGDEALLRQQMPRKAATN